MQLHGDIGGEALAPILAHSLQLTASRRQHNNTVFESRSREGVHQIEHRNEQIEQYIDKFE